MISGCSSAVGIESGWSRHRCGIASRMARRLVSARSCQGEFVILGEYRLFTVLIMFVWQMGLLCIYGRCYPAGIIRCGDMKNNKRMKSEHLYT